MSKDIDLIDESNQHWTHTHRYSKCREELALITTERDALQADNARLREALEDGFNKISQMCFEGEWTGIETTIDKIRKTLTAAPEQSLARIKNQVREECADFLEANRDLLYPEEAIRAMKEPE